MGKDLADMNYTERRAALEVDLRSPSGIAKADKLIDLMKYELRNIVGLRENAAILHGIAPAAPSATAGTPLVLAAAAEAIRGATVADLANRYRSDPASKYPTLRHKTREFYEALIKRVLADCSDTKLASLNEQALRNLYARWTQGGKTSMAHAQMTMLRTMANFVRTLGDPEADDLSSTLHRMHFSVKKARTEALTAEQANDIRQKLHDMGYASMALAQALQIGFELRQKEVIGEWVPTSEPGESDVTYADQKWLRGIRWEKIDNTFMLKHVTVDNKGRVVPFEVDLKKSTTVMEELNRAIERKGRAQSGPLIVSEDTGLPWTAADYRKRWRKAADMCGIPKTVKNMDSRGNADTSYRRKQARGRPELKLVTESR
jgi:hypothetical protein